MKISTKRLFGIILGAAAALGAWRSICMLMCYDPAVRYFERGFLPSLHNLLYVAGALFLALLLWRLPTEAIGNACELKEKGARLTIVISAACLVCGILLALRGGAEMKRLELLAGLFAIASSPFFFVLGLSRRTAESHMVKSAKPWLCIAVIAMLILLLASSYFDMTTTINGPFTTLFLFSALCCAVFFLCEMRMFIDRPAPKLHCITALASVFLAGSSSLGNLVFSLFVSQGAEKTASDPLRHLLLLAVSLYATVRLFSFSHTPPVASDENEALCEEATGENQQFEK